MFDGSKTVFEQHKANRDRRSLMVDDPVVTRWKRGKAHADFDSPAALPGNPEHDEWILDEAVQETFPASDPTLPSRPGSTLALRYSAMRSDRNARVFTIMLAPFALSAAFMIGAFLVKRVKRGPFNRS